MKKFKKLLAIALVATTGLVASGLTIEKAMAATDGTLGATSTGTSAVSLTISPLYKISGIADIALGSYSGTGALTGNDDVCVYSNGGTTYHVKVTDDTALSSASFAVEDATHTFQIPMTVKWNSATGTTGNAAVAYNTQLAGTGANTTSSDCSVGGNSANLQVNLDATALQAAPAAAYSSTLTLLIEP
jgi:hypothetical protein